MSTQLLGVVTHFETENTRYDLNASGLPRLTVMKEWIDSSGDMGAQVLRIPASWALLESVEGTYHQGYVEEQIELIRYAGESGIQVIYEFASAPVWARQFPNETYSPPVNEQDYADAIAHIYAAFSEANVSQYVAGVEIWNEPNVSAFWHGGEYRNDLSDHPQSQGVDSSLDYASAQAYTELLNSAYDSLKSVDPDVTVLGGSLAGTDFTYLNWMLENGAQMDGLAVHPYTRNYDGVVSKPARPGEDPNDYDVAPGLPADLNQRFSFEYGLNELKTILNDAGQENVDLWITEMGWRIEDYDDGNTNDDHLIVDNASEQASYIEEALTIVSGMDFVAAATVFQLHDTHDGDFGLIDENGEWRPSAQTLSNFIQSVEENGELHTISGTDGNDLLVDVIGEENYLTGGLGSDAYYYSVGGATDTIAEQGDAESTDTLVISGYAHDGLILTRVGDDLVIRQPNADISDEIIIKDQFSGRIGDGVEEVRFPNILEGDDSEVVWSREQIETYTDMNVGTVIAETTNTVYGTLDSDQLNGGQGNDLIISDQGDDIMFGSTGDDIFVGVAGNDQVHYTGEGSDRDDFVITRNENGSVTIANEQFGTDLLWDVSSVWFETSEEWVEIDELAA